MEIWKKMWVGVFFLNTVYVKYCAALYSSQLKTLQLRRTGSGDKIICIDISQPEITV